MAKKTPRAAGFGLNLILYYAAIGVIILGYVFLSIGSANSFTSLTLGPVILVVGYIVAMPVALLLGVNRRGEEPEISEASPPKTKTGRKA